MFNNLAADGGDPRITVVKGTQVAITLECEKELRKAQEVSDFYMQSKLSKD